MFQVMFVNAENVVVGAIAHPNTKPNVDEVFPNKNYSAIETAYDEDLLNNYSQYIYDGNSFLKKPIAFNQLQEEKIKQLSNQCRNSIMYEFVASNGHQYRLEIEDQLNMQGQKAELDDDTTITTVQWRTLDVGYVSHTREEWLTVYKEGFNHKKSQLFKLDDLRTQALNATTQEELDAIVW